MDIGTRTVCVSAELYQNILYFCPQYKATLIIASLLEGGDIGTLISTFHKI